MKPDEIVKRLHEDPKFPLDTLSIPARYCHALRNLHELTPGYKHEICRFVLDHMQDLYDGKTIILSGTIGSGKTVAACLAGIVYAIKYSLHVTPAGDKFDLGNWKTVPEHEAYYPVDNYVYFVNSHDFLPAAITPARYDIPQFQHLLIIDDFGREHFTDKGFGIAEWDYLFEHRYNSLLPMIITTNQTPEQMMKKYNRRIMDRLRECALWHQSKSQSLRKPEKDGLGQ